MRCILKCVAVLQSWLIIKGRSNTWPNNIVKPLSMRLWTERYGSSFLVGLALMVSLYLSSIEYMTYRYCMLWGSNTVCLSFNVIALTLSLLEASSRWFHLSLSSQLTECVWKLKCTAAGLCVFMKYSEMVPVCGKVSHNHTMKPKVHGNDIKKDAPRKGIAGSNLPWLLEVYSHNAHVPVAHLHVVQSYCIPGTHTLSVPLLSYEFMTNRILLQS